MNGNEKQRIVAKEIAFSLTRIGNSKAKDLFKKKMEYFDLGLIHLSLMEKKKRGI